MYLNTYEYLTCTWRADLRASLKQEQDAHEEDIERLTRERVSWFLVALTNEIYMSSQ